jgi:hypothetical protein
MRGGSARSRSGGESGTRGRAADADREFQAGATGSGGHPPAARIGEPEPCRPEMRCSRPRARPHRQPQSTRRCVKTSGPDPQLRRCRPRSPPRELGAQRAIWVNLSERRSRRRWPSRGYHEHTLGREHRPQPALAVERVAWVLSRRRAPVRFRHVTGNARRRVRAGRPDGNHDRTDQKEGQRIRTPHTS